MKEVMEGKMEGKRGPGRKRIGMIDELMLNEQYVDLKRRAEDRQGWRVWLQGPAVWQNTEEEDIILYITEKKRKFSVPLLERLRSC